MRNKNLFIVNTPFHLLTVFILLKGRFSSDENYLALIHPHGYEKWQDSPIMRYLSSNNCGWQQVFPLGNWLSSRHKTTSYKQQVAAVRNTIGKIGINNLYLGSDIDVQNQLLAGTLNIDKFYRYEDGLYSYYNEDRRRPLGHRLFHQGKIYILKLMAGINGKVSINTTTAGDNPSGIGDFMYKPELLQRFSPQSYAIERLMIEQALQDLTGKGLLNPVMKKNSILYLSQPLVEQKKLTREEEMVILREILCQIKGKGCLLYKPHPNDSADKLDHYRRTFSDMTIYNSIEPVELSFAYETNLKAVISYQSSALLFIDKFSPQKIPAISLTNFYKQPLHSAYVEIMQNAGVCFPKNQSEIAQFIS
ncbi:polysialyltransferase family glycosyltransferase [Sporomusa sp. GT1]|uniref:polysialyltransferase family glycosyltransferase n=1 Tax=Sporomusa sp. GT1 TaxID=1534747 RepID=UPI001662D912|nr:polysialyltransferase family glycosyltransferase [Sporomusa sp. GT1]